MSNDNTTINRRTFLAGSTLLATGTVATAAYSQATVTRKTDVTVVADDAAAAQLALNEGTADGVAINGNKQLEFTGEASSLQVTPDATYRFGSSSSPTSTHAFTVTNNLGETRGFLVDITENSFNGGDFAIEFYDDTGSFLDSASTETDVKAGFELTAGETVYTRVVIDTATSSGNTMTGTVTIEGDADTSITDNATQSSLSGTVTTTETSPTEDVTVKAVSPTDAVLAQTTTASDGTYTLNTSLPDGTTVVARLDSNTENASSGEPLRGAAERPAGDGSSPVDFSFQNSRTINPNGTDIFVFDGISETSTDDAFVDIGTAEELQAMHTYAADTDFRLVEDVDASATSNWNQTAVTVTGVQREFTNNKSNPATVSLYDGAINGGSITVFLAQNTTTATSIDTSNIDVTVTDAANGEIEVSASSESDGDTIGVQFDYDVQGTGLTALGSTGSAYSGTFDGQGYTITGIDVSTTGTEAGFIEEVDGATVRNVEFANVTAKGVNVPAAVIKSVCRGDAAGNGDLTVRNVTLSNSTVEHFDDGYEVGGVTGKIRNGANMTLTVEDVTIKNSTVTGIMAGGVFGRNRDKDTLFEIKRVAVDDTTTIDGNRASGGIIGGNNEAMDTSPVVRDVVVAGDVTKKNLSTSYAGGVVGTARNTTISRAVTTGTVTVGDSGFGGGIIGDLTGSGTVTECVAAATVSSSGSATPAGVAGRINNSSGTVESSAYWDTTSSGTDQTNGVGTNNGTFNASSNGLSTSSMQGSTALNAGNMENLTGSDWDTRSSDYPVPSDAPSL